MDAMRYGWSAGAQVESHSYLARPILGALQEASAGRVLDLGCGNGEMTSVISAAGYDVMGVEPSSDGVASARQAYPQFRFELGSGYDDLLAHYGAFDAIVSAEVIEHLYSPDNLVKRAREALNPGGHLILTTPYHGYLKNLAISLAGGWDKHFTALQEHMHIKFWSMQTLGELLERNGFTIVRWERVGRVPVLARSMIVIARKI